MQRGREEKKKRRRKKRGRASLLGHPCCPEKEKKKRSFRSDIHTGAFLVFFQITARKRNER